LITFRFPCFLGSMEHEDDVLVVICSFPDGETARQIGTLLVERQLAACVNLVANSESIYRWKGEIERASEVIGWIKTTRSRYPDLETAIRAAHPYEVPEILAVRVEAGLAGYQDWVREMVR
jgi:periplasmic divalent cation tolerance protein